MTLDVIIPCAGSAEFIEQTIASVLKQTRPAEAIYLVDNASDHSGYREAASRAASDRVHFVRFEERLSMSLNWQRCLGLGKGEACILLNDDDWLRPDAFETGLTALERNPGKSCVLLARAYVEEDTDDKDRELEKEAEDLGRIDALPEPARSFYLCTSSLNHMSALIFRRGPLGIPPQYRWLPDQAYLFGHAAQGGVLLERKSGAFIRQHGGSLTKAHFSANGRALYEERDYLRNVIAFFVEERGMTSADLAPVAEWSRKYYFRNVVRACFSWPWRRSRLLFGIDICRDPSLSEVLRRDLTGPELVWPRFFSSLASMALDLKYFRSEKRLRP